MVFFVLALASMYGQCCASSGGSTRRPVCADAEGAVQPWPETLILQGQSAEGRG